MPNWLVGLVERGAGPNRAALPLLALVLGCGAAAPEAKGPARPTVQAKDTRILHEECPVNDGGTQKEDVNGDGRPDRMTVAISGGACRALDFNFDGAIDAWVYLDSKGSVRRRENDYDRDGRVDEVSLYQAGVLSERDRATTLGGKLDTWHYYTAGKVARTERDSNGDEFVDQWWEYPDGRPEECPVIHSDVDGDGRPDPGATVDVCREQYVPGARDGQRPAPATPTGVTDVPTEVQPDPGNDAQPAPTEPSSEAPSGDTPPAEPGAAPSQPSQ